VVEHISHRVAVMYLGRLVEQAASEELFTNPLHPYTQALLASVPSLEPGEKKGRPTLAGDVPTPLNPPAGCPFHTRCPEVMDICRSEVPATVSQGSGHTVACHLYQIESPALQSHVPQR
jgi:oligopeptide transport system ATP-binding protein